MTAAPTHPQAESPATVAQWRALFPILAQRIHGQELAYLDNAATTQTPLAVQQAQLDFERQDRANIHRGVHTLSQRATDAFEAARATLHRFIGAGAAHELVFTSGTTEALNMVAFGLWGGGPGHAWLRPGDRIISTALEHHANLVPWQHAARMSGAELVVLRPDAQGRLSEADLAAHLTPNTRVLALTACANATGERPPFEAMLTLARQAGALTVLDAAQAVAHDTVLITYDDNGRETECATSLGYLGNTLNAYESVLKLEVAGAYFLYVGI